MLVGVEQEERVGREVGNGGKFEGCCFSRHLNTNESSRSICNFRSAHSHPTPLAFDEAPTDALSQALVNGRAVTSSTKFYLWSLDLYVIYALSYHLFPLYIL